MRRQNLAHLDRGICIFLLVSLALPLLFTATAPEPAAAWIDLSWTRRRPVIITAGGNGMPENYQVKIFVTYNPNMQADFDDLRFALANDTLLPYWIENYNLSENATVWVKVPFSLGASASQQIFMYYSNPSATSAENGDATFVLFDDFSGTSLDTNKWNDVGGTITVTGGYVQIVPTTLHWNDGIQNKVSLGDFAIDSRIWSSAAVNSAVMFRGNDANWLPSYLVFMTDNFNWQLAHKTAPDYAVNIGASAGSYEYNTWYAIKVEAFGSALKFYVTDMTTPIISQTDTNISSGYFGSSAWFESDTHVRFDYFRVRRYVSPEPTASVGEEELVGTVQVSNIQADNILLDRDVDWAGSDAKTGTTLRADVEYHFPYVVNQENVRFVIYDKLDAKIDNKQATSYTQLTDNKRRFFVNYSALDNTLSDSQLGGWDVKVEVYDNRGTKSTSNVFFVSDLTASSTTETVLKHKIRVYGAGSRVDGAAVTVENVWIEDNDVGTRPQTLTGNSYDDTYAPGAAGKLYLRLKSENLDGRYPSAPDNISYAFPNFSPTIVSVTSSQALIDRKQDCSGSGATLTTTLTVRIRDNDNRDDLNAARIAVRDALDTVQENQDVWASRVVVDENSYDVSYTHNPADNLPDANLGLFDVWRYAADKYGGVVSGWVTNQFTVDDLQSTIGFNPASPYVGWPLTVSGTHSRVTGGALTIDGAWLTDNKHGTMALENASSYSKTYAMTNVTLNENVGVSIRVLDVPLDGTSVSSYKIHENVKFEVWVRFEENYATVPWVPNSNRPLVVRFEWEGGTHTKTLTSNPENIIVPTAGYVSEMMVMITDNNAYWRYFISQHAGGQVTLVIVGNYLKDDGSLKVAQFRFFLQDYTTNYIPPDGQMLIKLLIGTNLAEINGGYWNADWRLTAWLVTGTQYQIWVKGVNAPLRIVGPIDAVVPSEEKTIVINAISAELESIQSNVAWAAWRENDNIIKIYYRDNLDNTITAHVRIYDMEGNLVPEGEFQPDNGWFTVTWLGAESGESYNVRLDIVHGEHGTFTMTFPIGLMDAPPGFGGGGVTEAFKMPISFAAIACIIIISCMGMLFDAPRAHIAVIAMALVTTMFWYMGFLPLPGGLYTVVLILFLAVLFALVWGRKH